MRITTFLIAFSLCLPVFAADEKPELVKVYCFSADLQAGFKDDVAEYVCRELGKRGKKKKSLLLTKTRGAAHVVVEYLGTEHVSKPGETTYVTAGYAWTPDQLKTGAKAILSVDEFTKGFHAAGVGGQATSGIAWKMEEWIRENRDIILEKAKQK